LASAIATGARPEALANRPVARPPCEETTVKRLIPALLLGLLSGPSWAQSAAPIKIGGSFDLSGPAAAVGQLAKTGTEYAVEVLNKRGGVLGRQVSLELQDNGTNAQRAVNQSTQLARDGVVLLLAPQSTGNTLAVTSAVSEKFKLPMCVGDSAGDDVTMKAFQPYMWSVTPNQYMMFRAVAVRVAKGGFKRIGMIAVDTAGGHIGNERFKAFIKELAPQAQIVVEEFPKVGASDYTPSLNKIAAAKPDFVFANMFGTDVVTVHKQGQAIGFFKQVHNNFAVLADTTTLKTLGHEAVLGTIAYARTPFNYLVKTPAGREFVQAFHARYGTWPADDTTQAYDCVMSWAAAVQAAKSTRPDDVMRAVTSTEFDSARGKYRIAAFDHMGDLPVFVGPIAWSKEYDQPVIDVDQVVPGDVARPTEAVVRQSRQGS
jgi:branched-chain amino acid transport system substrate-binding protein